MRLRHLVVLSLLMSCVPPTLFAATGRLVFVSNRVTGGSDGRVDLFSADDDGGFVQRVTPESFFGGADFADPDWSPDGKRVVFSAYTGGFTYGSAQNWDLFIADASGVQRLTDTPQWEMTPSWSPDGEYIAFSSPSWFASDIYVMRSDGTGRRRITDAASRASACGNPSAYWPDWLGNGQLVFSMHASEPSQGNCAQFDLFTVGVEAGWQSLKRVTSTPIAAEMHPAGSPDGTRIAYESLSAIWTVNADGTNPVRITDGRGGHADYRPDWSPDGSRIAFHAGRPINGYPDGAQIWTMNADGSDLVAVTRNVRTNGDNRDPSWVALPSTLDVLYVSPRSGTNNGYSTVTIYGTAFDSTVSVSLSGLAAEIVEVSGDGRWLKARLDLRGVAAGAKDLVLSKRDGTHAVLPESYTVIDDPAPQGSNGLIWSDVSVRDALRPGQKAYGFIRIGNNGTEDAIAHLAITLDDGATLLTDYYHGPLSAESADIDFSLVRDKVRRYDPERGTWTTVIPLVTVVEAGSSLQLPMAIQMPEPGGECPRIEVAVLGGSVTAECLFSVADLASGLVPGHECVKGPLWSTGIEVLRMRAGVPTTTSAFAVEMLKVSAKCALSLWPPGAIILKVNDMYDAVAAGSGIMQNCFGGGGAGGATCVQSGDPNDKIGASGAGAPRWISGVHAIPYSIFFENKPEATAAAQDVIITDQLDASKLDLDSFAFGPVWFDTHIAAPRVPSSEFTADIDLRPAKPLIARVEASLDKATAVVTWKFQSLDPATMLPTTDVLAGFLPPNVNAPEGDGGVSFTVMPREGLGTGTTISNGARIVFDRNAPIDTPVWSNSIDRDAPSSAASAQSAVACGDFMVSWSGHDLGSGIVSYDVYVSKDAGPFARWLERTTATSAMFEGEPRHNYAFYSVALDAVGHLEDPPATPDVVVTVADTTPPVITAPAALTLSTGASATACGITIDDTALGAATATDNCGTPEVSDNVPSNNFFPVGTTIITYTAIDAAGNVATATQTVTVADATPPLLTTTADVSTSNTPGVCGAAVTIVNATATDHCGIATITGTRSDGLALDAAYPVGLTIITWSAVDVHRNTATAQQNISVADTEAPTLSVPAPIVVDFASEEGAAVAYTVTSADNCEVKSVTCSSASGTVFPIGTTLVSCVATDLAGNTTAGSFDVHVRGARGVKSAVRDDLVALRSTVTAAADARGLDTAIESLNSALDPAGWIDETHIEGARSNRVFNDEKDAANALHNLARDRRSTVDAALLNRQIARIVACDRLLARVAALESTDPRNAIQANAEIQRGDLARDADRPGVAIEHYRNAWLHATKK